MQFLFKELIYALQWFVLWKASSPSYSTLTWNVVCTGKYDKLERVLLCQVLYYHSDIDPMLLFNTKIATTHLPKFCLSGASVPFLQQSYFLTISEKLQYYFHYSSKVNFGGRWTAWMRYASQGESITLAYLDGIKKTNLRTTMKLTAFTELIPIKITRSTAAQICHLPKFSLSFFFFFYLFVLRALMSIVAVWTFHLRSWLLHREDTKM